MMRFDSAQVDLALIPLLSKKIEVGLISIQGLAVNLHTRKDGSSNLDSSETIEEDVAQPETKQDNKTTQPAIKDLVVQGIQVTDAKIVIENLQQNSSQTISSLNFEMGKLELGKAVSLALEALIDSDDTKMEINAKGHIQIAKNLQRIDFIKLVTDIVAKGETLPDQEVTINNVIKGYFDATNKVASIDEFTMDLLGINIKGNLTAKLTKIPSIEYKVTIGDVDVDAILADTAPAAETNATVQQQAVNLDWMKTLNVKGLVTIKSVKVANLTMSDMQFPLQLNNAKLNLSAIKAQLYDGRILANVTLDGRNKIPTFSTSSTLENVQALPLVKDLMDKELISGAVNMSFDINGSGLDQISLRKNTKGSGKFAFSDGAIHGVNVAQLVRNAYAKIKGQPVNNSEQPKQTDFASFTGSFNLADGIVKNSDLNLVSPLLRISGAGNANIIDEVLNYKLKTAVVGTLEGQGGKPITDLKKLTIPLKIKGPMHDPKISLDMNDLFKSKAKDKLKNKLKGIFGN